MINADMLKKTVIDAGAVSCGLAPAGRFRAAPAGFRPEDIYGKCRTVLVFGLKVPSEVFTAESCIPYTHISDVITREVDALTYRLSLKFEEMGLDNGGKRS